MAADEAHDPALTRFRRRITVDHRGCWNWTGQLAGGGYGRIRLGDGVRVQAHRFAYEAFRGPIPDGLQLDHLCRNRACCNPAHLEPVTARENCLRGVSPAAQQAKQVHCSRGHELTGDNLRLRGTKRECRTCAQLMRSHWLTRNADRVRAHKRAQYAMAKAGV